MFYRIFSLFATLASCIFFVQTPAQEEIRFETLRSAAIASYSKEIAKICNIVYKEYPYLYDGQDAGYEEYLESYKNSNHAVVSIAFNGDRVIGVATGIPMSETRDRYKEPFLNNGYNLAAIYYLGELVILPEYRGKGIGTNLYQGIECSAKEDGYSLLCLGQIDESQVQAAKPDGYMSSDGFWIKCGLICHPELNYLGYWTNIGDTQDVAHYMIYWMKAL